MPAREAIARAKRLAKIERRRSAVVGLVDAIAQQAAELGLVVPE